MMRGSRWASSPHKRVVEFFLAGTTARNDRMSTDGHSIWLDKRCCLATKYDGFIIVNSTKNSGGKVARNAVRMGTLFVPHVWVHCDPYDADRADLVKAFVSYKATTALIPVATTKET